MHSSILDHRFQPLGCYVFESMSNVRCPNRRRRGEGEKSCVFDENNCVLDFTRETVRQRSLADIYRRHAGIYRHAVCNCERASVRVGHVHHQLQRSTPAHPWLEGTAGPPRGLAVAHSTVPLAARSQLARVCRRRTATATSTIRVVSSC